VSLAPVPDSISLELAAAVLRDGVLAHRVVNDLAAIGAGDSVLLHGTRDIWPLAQWCDHVGAGMLHEGSPAKCASVIIDFTGGRDWQVLLERAAPGARLVVLDAPADVPDLPVGMLSKLNIHLRVAMLCDRGDDDVRLRNRAWTVWRAVDAGWLMPSPPVVMPLSLAAEAHAHAEADPAVKIILAM
jgi:NADPH:quinone reductase-like Zn-dependent oxidoreductase